MSLRRALLELPGDRSTESATREALQLFRVRPREPLSVDEVVRRLDRPEPIVSAILTSLAGHFVLRTSDDGYLYEPDSFTDLEIDRFLRRADESASLVQSNVAKFRARHGYH